MIAQTQVFTKTLVPDYQQLALFLKSETASYVESAPNIIYVAAHYVESPFYETAVVKLSDDINAPHTIVESLTIGWIKPNELVDYLVDAAKSQTSYGHISLALAFDKQSAMNITAQFECGCCGTYFRDNIIEQAKFNQDSGYGICDLC